MRDKAQFLQYHKAPGRKTCQFLAKEEPVASLTPSRVMLDPGVAPRNCIRSRESGKRASKNDVIPLTVQQVNNHSILVREDNPGVQRSWVAEIIDEDIPLPSTRTRLKIEGLKLLRCKGNGR